MKLIVALGNPGERYLKTRHNAGFLLMDHLVSTLGITDYQAKFKGAYTTADLNNQKVGFLKPLTFMNASGSSVQACCQFFKLEAKNIIVFHDDLDLPFADIKVKFGGSSGGHNGIKDIQNTLGTSDFWRLRIGIDRPPLKEQVSDYVLAPFSEADLTYLAHVYDEIVSNAQLLLDDQTIQELPKKIGKV